MIGKPEQLVLCLVVITPDISLVWSVAGLDLHAYDTGHSFGTVLPTKTDAK